MADSEKDVSTPTQLSGSSEITILNQLINDERGIYRIQLGDKLAYLTIPADVFDEDTLCTPYLLIPNLPEFPTGDWTRIHITSNAQTGFLEVATTSDPLPAIQSTWHPLYIDVHSLPQARYHRANVREVVYEGKPAIAKWASWEWDIPRLDNETDVYSVLNQHQSDHPQDDPIAPRFLAHLTENGRVMGLLLEKLEGRFASIQDLEACRDTVRKFHELGIIHGDLNRYNFIIDEESGQAKLLDFEHADDFDEEKARLEIQSLESELSEETGRGGPGRVVDS